MAVSTSSKAVSSRRSAGFTLFEALVALVVAGLLFPTLGRALAQAWTASRTPFELLSAVSLARDAAAERGPVAALGYGIASTSAALSVEVLPSDLAPAPAHGKEDKAADEFHPEAVPTGMRLAIPKSFASAPPGGAPAPPSALALRRLSVVVTTPSGRRVALDAIRLDASRP